MSYPSRKSYELAIQKFDTKVLAPRFKGGQPLLNEARSGGYCVIYPVQIGSRKEVLRCWIADPGNFRVRCKYVREYLNQHSLPYFVDFDYIDNGIVAKGVNHPVCYMEWVDGLNLYEFLDNQISVSAVIHVVAEKFRIMVSDLHSKGISHGDLQPGNIMVCKNSTNLEIKLVDYDSLHVPTLKGVLTEPAVGIPEFQHPHIKLTDEKADYFSELVVYLSLLTYAEQPSRWRAGEKERFLFEMSDYIDPAKSQTFQEIKKLSGVVRQLAVKLEEICKSKDPNSLLPLERVIGASSDEFMEFFGSTLAIPPSTPSEIADFFVTPMLVSPSKNPAPPKNIATSELDGFFRPQPRPSHSATSIPPAPSTPATSLPPFWQRHKATITFLIVVILIFMAIVVLFIALGASFFFGQNNEPMFPIPIATSTFIPTRIPTPASTVTPNFNGTYFLNTTCSEFTDLTVRQITVSDFNTQVEFQLTSSKDEARAHLSPPGSTGAFYIISQETLERFELQNVSSGIAVDPDWTELKKGDVLEFTLTFERISNSTRTMNIIEGDTRNPDFNYFDCLNVSIR